MIENTESIAYVGDVRLWDATVDLTLPTRQVEALFTLDPDLPAVVVTRDGALFALLSRKVLLLALSRPLGRDLYIKRPVAEIQDFMDRAPLLLPHTLSVAAAVEQALSRPSSLAYEPLLVMRPDGRPRTLAVDLLLRVQSALLDRAMQTKDELLAEVRQGAAELRAALTELEQARDRLVQSEKMAALGQLVAGIAHEINTPIGVALTAATHLGERTSQFSRDFAAGQMKRSDLANYVELAGQSTELLQFNIQRAARLIQSFKQVAVDQASEQRRRFELHDYLDQLVTSLRPEARRLKHTVELDCAPGIEMNSYPGALAQVLSNLVSNAMVHAYPEGVGGAIRVAAEQQGSQVSFSVSDDGRGIPAEDLGRIYDPFFTTRRSAGGSGLGLHIVFNIVSETFRGVIDCRSAAGAGTCFRIEAPLETPE